jgi:CxxC motif-containing protein (DUF1111 family)
MQRLLTALSALILLLGFAIAQEAPAVRTDLTAEDLARVAAITAPTTDFSRPEDFETNQGGAGTVTKIVNGDIFSFSAANLSFEQEEQFKLGNALFRKVWVSAPSSTEASDGLGPFFNSRACQNCHIKDGRGHPPIDAKEIHPLLTYGEAPMESMFLRLSVPPATPEQQASIDGKHALVIGEPRYGTQLQDLAVQGLKAEGKMTVTYREVPVTLDDGTVVKLREAAYGVSDLSYGDMAADVMMSPRVAPQMIGLGLIEAIPPEDILALTDPDDANGDGISGKANMVRDVVSGEIVLGRFGWKAGTASIREQAAAAFLGDMGLSTPLFLAAHGDCTAYQQDCLAAPSGEQERLGVSEAPDPVLDLVEFYSQTIGVPQRRRVGDPDVLAGKELFYGAGCVSCHTPKFVTSRNAAADVNRFQLIWPYSDFLLHDLGEGLADHRPEGDADGYEWRTPPLWGIGLTETVSGHTFFLHDGRARNLAEAILWHGGEAQRSRDAFAALPADDRAKLIAFLESL